MDIPRVDLPKALDIPYIYFKPPSARIPSYNPMVIPPADLERPEETEAADDKKTEQPEPCLLYTSDAADE